MNKYWLSVGLTLTLASAAIIPAQAQPPLGRTPSAQAYSTPTPTSPVPATQTPITAPTAGPGAPGSIYTATTVNEFLADCRSDQSGCMNEVGNAFLKHMNDTDDTICLNDITYGTPVPGWLNDHAETHTMPAENGIYLALQKLYPCDAR